MLEFEIRRAQPGDLFEIWNILRPMIRAGETYTFPRDMSQKDALAYWLAPDHQTFVASDRSGLVGTYYLRPNHTGGGAHVANCGFVVRESAQGRGVASTMCIHSQGIARKAGFTAMQFNFVLATNEGAIHLWEKLGFETVGRLPEAFNHPREGMVDALVMFKRL
ncbi:MAG TPA: N-acetyltransferase [Devosia sp.]|nr:N-acetyltransferase [Devosia sp.]